MSSQIKSNENYFSQDEIDLIEFLRKLIDSKKLLIISMLVFLSLSFFYNLTYTHKSKSTALFEIGSYFLPDGSEEIFENSQELIDKLNINFVFGGSNKGNETRVLFFSLNDKAIKVEIISRSSQNNKKKLQEIIKYTEDRHTKISNKKLSHQLNNLQTQINILEKFTETNLNSIVDEKSENQLVFQIENLQSLSALKNKLQDINSIDLKKSQVIGSIKTETLGLNKYLILLLGIVSGLIAGVLLILIIDFRNSYRAKISSQY